MIKWSIRQLFVYVQVSNKHIIVKQAYNEVPRAVDFASLKGNSSSLKQVLKSWGMTVTSLYAPIHYKRVR